MTSPTWRKSEFVDVEFKGHTWRFRRLGARRLSAMKVRALNIKQDSVIETYRVLVDAGEIEKILGDLADGLVKIDGDPIDGERSAKVDLLDLQLTDDGVLGLWFAYQTACAMDDADRGKSDAPSKSPTSTAPESPTNSSTTAAGALITTESVDVAGIH